MKPQARMPCTCARTVHTRVHTPVHTCTHVHTHAGAAARSPCSPEREGGRGGRARVRPRSCQAASCPRAPAPPPRAVYLYRSPALPILGSASRSGAPGRVAAPLRRPLRSKCGRASRRGSPVSNGDRAAGTTRGPSAPAPPPRVQPRAPDRLVLDCPRRPWRPWRGRLCLPVPGSSWNREECPALDRIRSLNCRPRSLIALRFPPPHPRGILKSN